MKIHIVQKGDTLWKIAKKYGVNFEELKHMNAQLSNPDMIMPGMKIKVPTSGGTVKKETQIKYGSKEAPKKEMPKTEHPFKEQKPMTMPAEQPKAEKPKEAQKPFTPKMPQPVIPEIDINNYYMMNMQVQPKQQPMQQPMQQPVQQPKQQPMQQVKPQAKPQPQTPPKPANILPKATEPKKETPKTNHSVKGVQQEESLEMPQPQQGGFTQPMYYNPNQSVPVSPVMPGFGHGGNMQPWQGGGMGPWNQVQGAQYPQMNMPMMHHGYDEDSSSFMPFMPNAQSPMQMPMQMPMQSPMQMPMQSPMQMPMQMPMGQPGVMGASDENQMMHQGMPQPCYPVSPMMPGPGFCGPGGFGMPGPWGQDQVQGAMMDGQMPMGQPGVMGAEMHHQMPMGQPGVMGAEMHHQMPMGQPGVMGAEMHHQMPMGQPGVMGAQMHHQMLMGQPGVMGAQMNQQMPMGQPGVMGASDQEDCGCGGPQPQGQPQWQQQAPQWNQPMPYGMPQPQGFGPGMMGQGLPQGMQMGAPRAFSMPNFYDEDNEG
ncbi:SafA/ExsA family spore coat assembly protein [Rossellomorea marisflavi]|uniref:SafA/ExsA family spore coat assembly protein n=1 Tax=Rossellomorea marisflavi TaxID=189381 RepID=UPI0013168BB0|nr:SafA/ExsA family spore coat assembly protein [Rossellomorea marisflavi]QHA37103.1 SafA/ExsA family spore coat assembly protein [Rossellomorea marisflavi]